MMMTTKILSIFYAAFILAVIVPQCQSSPNNNCLRSGGMRGQSATNCDITIDPCSDGSIQLCMIMLTCPEGARTTVRNGCVVCVNSETCEQVDPQHGRTHHVPNLLGDDDVDHGCRPSAGMSWCEAENRCIHSWEGCHDLLGDDEDENGCLVSAGYSWCESKSKCLRPSEEECDDEDHILLGDDKDESGCLLSAGYSWCESKSKCLRPWEEECDDGEAHILFGDDEDENGCLLSAGYSWCESKSKCLRPWEEQCDVVVGGDRDEHQCIGSAGYSWCESKSKCLRVWEEECDDVHILSDLPGKSKSPSDRRTHTVRSKDAPVAPVSSGSGEELHEDDSTPLKWSASAAGIICATLLVVVVIAFVVVMVGTVRNRCKKPEDVLIPESDRMSFQL